MTHGHDLNIILLEIIWITAEALGLLENRDPTQRNLFEYYLKKLLELFCVNNSFYRG
jgi:hypothetical protein